MNDDLDVSEMIDFVLFLIAFVFVPSHTHTHTCKRRPLDGLISFFFLLLLLVVDIASSWL